MMHPSSRRALFAAVVVAAIAPASSAFAQSQLVLQKSNSISLASAFATGTGYGSNPLSVAFDGTNAYVGGYNSSAAAATIGVVRVDNVFSSAALTPLAATQFTSPASRGIDQMDYGAGALFLAHDAGSSPNVPFVRRVNPTTGATEWQIDNPQGARPMALAVDPVGNAGQPAVSFLVQGSGFVRRLNAADGSTILSNTTPNTMGIFASPPGSSYRSLDFDSTGNLIYGEDTGVGVGIRDLTATGNNYNRVVKVEDPTSAGTSPVIIKTSSTAITNNVGTGATFLEHATSDGSELIAFSPRISGAGNTAGVTATLTPLAGTATTVEAKRAQIRFLNGNTTNGTISLSQTELLGNEDGIGSAYAGELKNFATMLDANGNPVLLVVDYFTKQLDVYTIEPRYSVDADSTWSTASTWTAGIVPNSRTTNATFGNNITAARTVTLDGDKTVKQLKFDSANRYTIAGTNTINLTAPGNDNLNAYITVLNGSHTVNAPLVLGTNARFDVNNAADTLSINTVSGNGKVLAKRGLGTVSAQHIRVNTLAIENGLVQIRPNATEAGLSRVGALTLGTTGTTPTVGTLDLTNNGIIVDYAPDAANPYADLQAAIAAGRITNSTAGANNVIGIVDYATAPLPTFADPALLIDATSVFVRSTIKGDANLSGKVDFSDLVILAQNYNKQGALYQQGDFDYDTDVDFGDLVALAQNYNKTLSLSELNALGGADFASDFMLAQSLVPEPTTLAVAAAAGLLLRRRR